MEDNRIDLPTTVEELAKVRDSFLEVENLGNSLEVQRLFAMMVQHLPPNQDWFDPEDMGRCIRKALINEAAYFLLKPEAYEQFKAEQKEANEAPQGPTGQVVQEA